MTYRHRLTMLKLRCMALRIRILFQNLRQCYRVTLRRCGSSLREQNVYGTLTRERKNLTLMTGVIIIDIQYTTHYLANTRTNRYNFGKPSTGFREM